MFYSFAVSAVNAIGESPVSGSMTAIAASKPGQATAFVKGTSDATQITFSWTHAPDNGTPLTNYDVYWNAGSGSTFTVHKASIGVVNTYSTSPTTADLTDGSLYKFKVMAHNVVGSGLLSSSIDIYAATKPNPPAAPTMVSQEKTAITIAWTALNVADNGGSPITDYSVYWD